MDLRTGKDLEDDVVLLCRQQNEENNRLHVSYVWTTRLFHPCFSLDDFNEYVQKRFPDSSSWLTFFLTFTQHFAYLFFLLQQDLSLDRLQLFLVIDWSHHQALSQTQYMLSHDPHSFVYWWVVSKNFSSLFLLFTPDNNYRFSLLHKRKKLQGRERGLFQEWWCLNEWMKQVWLKQAVLYLIQVSSEGREKCILLKGHKDSGSTGYPSSTPISLFFFITFICNQILLHLRIKRERLEKEEDEKFAASTFWGIFFFASFLSLSPKHILLGINLNSIVNFFFFVFFFL